MTAGAGTGDGRRRQAHAHEAAAGASGDHTQQCPGKRLLREEYGTTCLLRAAQARGANTCAPWFQFFSKF